MIKHIKNISFIIVLMVIGYGIFTNGIHIYQTHKTITYNFDGKEMKKIKQMKKTLEITSNSIENLGTEGFTKEELETIKNDLDVTISMMDEMNLWNFEGRKKLNINDIYKIKEEIGAMPLLTITSLAKIKTNHGDTMIEKIVNNSFDVFSNYMEEDASTLKNSYIGASKFSLEPSISYLNYYMETINAFGTWVLEEGEHA